MANQFPEITYDIVKQSFESEGYILLSTEYKGAQQYLYFICPNGHHHKIKWCNWNTGQRCGKCRYVTYEQVKQSFESEGYILLSKKYENSHTMLYFICPNGHNHKMSWSTWNSGVRCGICRNITYEHVKKSFEAEGYTLLSTEYIDNKQYLYFICPNGHHHKIKWNSWNNGQRCKYCSKYNVPVTHNKVKLALESEGYTLLSIEYTGSQKYLYFICPRGHHHKIKWNDWQQGVRCGLCFGTHKHTYEQIKQAFESEGYVLLSTEYIDNSSYLYFICPRGHYHKIMWLNWQRGQRCKRCSNNVSKPEMEIHKYVEENTSYKVLFNNRKLIKNPLPGKRGLEIDILIPELKMAIEYGAFWWHGDKRNKNGDAEYTVWKDNYKKQWLKDNGWKHLIINHTEWVKNKDWDMINNFINDTGVL